MSGYGETFPLWRTAAGPVWNDYVRHPFVAGLGNGTLPHTAFLHYLRQDYLFLVHFSRAWALAVTKADTVEEMRTAAATVHALICDEIELHVRLCADEGISEKDLFATEEDPANIAYSRYVLDAGHSGDFLDLMAALAPCVLGYGEIGTQLDPANTKGAYRDWVETYKGAAYQETCEAVGTLIDAAIARRLGPDPVESPRWQVLCDRFRVATRLEVGFWEMGLAAG